MEALNSEIILIASIIMLLEDSHKVTHFAIGIFNASINGLDVHLNPLLMS